MLHTSTRSGFFFLSSFCDVHSSPEEQRARKEETVVSPPLPVVVNCLGPLPFCVVVQMGAVLCVSKNLHYAHYILVYNISISRN